MKILVKNKKNHKVLWSRTVTNRGTICQFTDGLFLISYYNKEGEWFESYFNEWDFSLHYVVVNK